jgi:hypothetical protein
MDDDSTDQCSTIIRHVSSGLPYRYDRGVLVRSIPTEILSVLFWTSNEEVWNSLVVVSGPSLPH